MMRSRKAAGISVFLAVAFLAACGGGGGGGQQTANAVPAGLLPASAPAGGSISAKAATGASAPVTVSFKIPKRAGASAAVKAAAQANRRSPKFISPGTQFVVVTTFPSGSSTGLVNCVDQATCSVTLAATATDTSVNVTLYGGCCTDQLSTGNAPIALTAGVPSNVTVTLDGITPALALTAPVAQLVVNYSTSFTATTVFPDFSMNLIGGPFGNVVDPNDNLILDSTGATINVNSSASDGTLNLSGPTFVAGPPYSLTQTFTYNGAAPTAAPITVEEFQIGGDSLTSNPLALQVVSPLTLTTGSNQFLLATPDPQFPVAAPFYAAEFVDLTPVTANMTVTANYTGFGPLPTQLTLTSDGCTGSFISAPSPALPSPVPFTGTTAAVSFTISAANSTGPSGCIMAYQDNAGPPGPNSLFLQINIDNAQVLIQGKKRK